MAFAKQQGFRHVHVLSFHNARHTVVLPLGVFTRRIAVNGKLAIL